MEFHPTIKFTTDYSETSIGFLVAVSNIKIRVLKDWFICKTYKHAPIFRIIFVSPSQLWERFSSQSGSPTEYDIFKQFLFRERCNDLEDSLIGRRYSEKMVWKEVLRARLYSKEEPLEREPREKKQQKLTMDITYYPVFLNMKEIFKDLNILLTLDNWLLR